MAANVAIFMAIAEGLVVALIIVLLRNVWGHVFSNEKGVIKYVETMMPIVAASSFLDGIQTVLSGFLLNILSSTIYHLPLDPNDDTTSICSVQALLEAAAGKRLGHVSTWGLTI